MLCPQLASAKYIDTWIKFIIIIINSWNSYNRMVLGILQNFEKIASTERKMKIIRVFSTCFFEKIASCL